MVGSSRVAAVVLAAGEGKRLKSSLPKVLHTVAGRPLLVHALACLDGLDIDRTVVVVSARRDEIARALEGVGAPKDLEYVVQDPPRGTGDAVRIALEHLGSEADTVLVTNGDAPLLTAESMGRLLAAHTTAAAGATMLTTELPPGSDLGRVIRSADGTVDRIVEVSDATDEELGAPEGNAGVYVFDSEALGLALKEIDTSNAQGEFYLTDAISLLRNAGKKILAERAPWEETRGVNDRAQLAESAAILRRRTAEKWMAEGVSILDPNTTFIDVTVTIEPDATILPFTFLEGDTTIGTGASIGPQTRVVDSTIEEGADVTFAVVKGSRVGPGASVGPYASLRPGTVIGKGARLGTFVESKNARLGDNSKAPHLSYLGDAEIGEHVNVGAGTITCNWDGQNKHETVIEDDAYISSDTMLVAPVRIGKRAATGAGAVVTQDVPDDALAVGVPARIIEGKGNRKDPSRK